MKQTQKIKLLKKLDVVVMVNVFFHFQVFYILLYTCSLDQAKNVLNVTKLQH